MVCTGTFGCDTTIHMEWAFSCMAAKVRTGSESWPMTAQRHIT